MSSQPFDLPETVKVGRQVTFELTNDVGERERLTLDIVPDSAADFAAGFLGVGAPLAQAVMGRPAGSVVPYRMADIVEARVIAIEPSTRTPSAAAAAREAATQEAVERANREDIVRLALTVDVKWGEYDPEPLEPPEE